MDFQMIDTDLYTYLTSLMPVNPSTGLPFPVQQDTISEDKGQDRVWYMREEDNTEVFLNGGLGLTTSIFSIEIITLLRSTQNTILTALVPLNGFSGQMSNGKWIRYAEITNAQDDYVYKNQDRDEGYHIKALRLTIIYKN